MVSVCDLALAAPGAFFGYPEVRRGLVAAMVMPHLLRQVGERAARWMLLTGELMDAAEAERVGLINRVVEADSLLETAQKWAESVGEGGPLALAETKRLLATLPNQPLPLEEWARASAEPRFGPECREGLAAFFEKRPNPWSVARHRKG